jgi:predicted nuclease with TOPRIM domain
MSNDEDWKDPYEESGVTLGPEEALRREIEKSKSLKVERLKLKDKIEKLRAENAHLTQNIETLKEETLEQRTNATSLAPSSPSRISLFLLIFNLCALGILLFFLLQK